MLWPDAPDGRVPSVRERLWTKGDLLKDALAHRSNNQSIVNLSESLIPLAKSI
jgi:hypothetical protein